MKKGLLIDDLSLKGWKSVLELAVIKNTATLDYALNSNEAKLKLKGKYDFIFLDIRFTEEDHNSHIIEEFSGFRILKNIKQDFSNINFSTPILLITGSNKIWNIEAFRDYGIDAYFIKEHPDYIYDKEYSRKNLNTLQKSYINLLELSSKRNQAWKLCNSIITTLEKHSYFNSKDKYYQNVKQRIIDKIKLGYAYLFSKQTSLENKVLLANNESISFIVFWSTLEEISKGFTNYNETWDAGFNRKKDWRFRNGIYFIETLNSNQVKVNISRDNYGNYINNFVTYSNLHNEYTSPIINLSIQIYSLLSAYISNDSLFKKLSLEFKSINRYRNDTDYTHGTVEGIFKKELVNSKKTKDAFSMNIKILTFIRDILRLKTN